MCGSWLPTGVKTMTVILWVVFRFSEPHIKLNSFMGGLSAQWWEHSHVLASPAYELSTVYCPPTQSNVGG